MNKKVKKIHKMNENYNIPHRAIPTEVLIEDGALQKLLDPINCKFFALCVIRPTSTEELLEKVTGKKIIRGKPESYLIYAYTKNLSKITGENEVLISGRGEEGKIGRPRKFYDLNFDKLIPLVLHKYGIKRNLENYRLFQRLYENRGIRELILNPFIIKIRVLKKSSKGSQEVESDQIFNILKSTFPVTNSQKMNKMSAYFIHLFFTLPIAFALYYHIKREGMEFKKIIKFHPEDIEELGFESYSRPNLLKGEPLYPEFNLLAKKPINIIINEESFNSKMNLQKRYEMLMQKEREYHDEINELDEISREIYNIYLGKVLFPKWDVSWLLQFLEDKKDIMDTLQEGETINLKLDFFFNK